MNKKNISKIFMIFGISILVLAIIGSTFAYYVWTTGEEDTTKIVTGIGAATVIFDGGSDIENANLRPVSDKSKGQIINSVIYNIQRITGSFVSKEIINKINSILDTQIVNIQCSEF